MNPALREQCSGWLLFDNNNAAAVTGRVHFVANMHAEEWKLKGGEGGIQIPDMEQKIPIKLQTYGQNKCIHMTDWMYKDMGFIYKEFFFTILR